MKIKITGKRSVHSKLLRLANELESDAERIGEMNTRRPLAIALIRIASDMRHTANVLELYEPCTTQ